MVVHTCGPKLLRRLRWEGSLKPRKVKWVMIEPLHSSLGDRTRPYIKKKKRKKEKFQAR